MLDAIGQEVDVPETDVTINIRDDTTSLFESESGELFIETDDGFYRMEPTPDGFAPVPTAKPDTRLSELAPARREDPEIETGGIGAASTTQIMD